MISWLKLSAGAGAAAGAWRGALRGNRDWTGCCAFSHAGFAILLDAVSFVVSAVSIWAIRRREPAVERQQHLPEWHEISEGFRVIAVHPLLRPLGFRTVTAAFFSGFLSTLYMLFGIEYMGLSPAVLGVLITLGGLSSGFC